RHQVPARLGHDHAFAVNLAAARAAASGARRRGPAAATLRVGETVLDPRDGVGLIAAVIDEVDVPDARTAGSVVGRAVAGVAVSDGGVLGEEGASDARGVEAEAGVDVGDRLARVGDRGIDAVVVDAVAPLVVEDGGNLAGVGASVAEARAEEVDSDAVPERV